MSNERIAVRVAELKVAKPDSVLYAIGLGSCVAVGLYDARERVGGLAHVMLPSQASSRKPSPPGKFANTAVEQLIAEMLEAGALKRRLYARLVGGASMFDSILADEGPSMGMRNLEAVRIALAAASIPIRGEAVGGNHGRTVHFHVSDGRMIVTSVRHPDVVL